MRSQRTNEELVAEYQRAGEPEVLEAICERNGGLVFSAVKGFRGVYSIESKNRAAVVGSDDLEQCGYIGLIEAVKSYDPDRGTAFSTAAMLFIKASICRELYRAGYTIRLPHYAVSRLRRLKMFRERFIKEQGRKPSEDEIKDFMGLSREVLRELLQIEMRTNLDSLNMVIGNDSDGLTLGEVVPDEHNPFEEVEERVQNEQLKRDLWGFVDSLKPEYASILHRFYEDGETLEQIGNSQELTEKRVKSMKENALDTLRRGRCRRVLAEYSDGCDKVEGIAYTGSYNSFVKAGSSTERAALMMLSAEENALQKLRRRMVFAEHGLSYKERKNYYELMRAEEKRVRDEQNT